MWHLGGAAGTVLQRPPEYPLACTATFHAARTGTRLDSADYASQARPPSHKAPHDPVIAWHACCFQHEKLQYFRYTSFRLSTSATWKRRVSSSATARMHAICGIG